MGKVNTPKFIKSVRMAVSKHSPEILTGIGIAGMVSTTILAVKATPKAVRLLNEYRDTMPANQQKIPPVDAIKVCWKCYAPAAVTGIASIACLIGATSVSASRTAALATAYKLSETALSEYREKVVETIGEKKEQHIRDKVAAEQVKNNPVSTREVIVTGHGDTLCFDPMSGRYFNSNIEKIKKAENEINRQMLHDLYGYASLNDFYDELDLPRTEVGDIIGWNTNRLVDMGISSHVSDDGRPSIVLDYRTRPDYNYDV